MASTPSVVSEVAAPPKAAGDEGATKVHHHPQPPRRVHDVHEVQVVLQPSVEQVVHLCELDAPFGAMGNMLRITAINAAFAAEQGIRSN